MSEPFTEEELTKAREVLALYVEDHQQAGDVVPLRPNCFCMTEEEIEGEVIDIVLSYLSRRYAAHLPIYIFYILRQSVFASRNLARQGIQYLLFKTIKFQAPSPCISIAKVKGEGEIVF